MKKNNKKSPIGRIMLTTPSLGLGKQEGQILCIVYV
jgi:hypothetical protein